MAYYASERAAQEIGVPAKYDLGDKRSFQLSAALAGLTGTGAGERTVSHSATFEERVFHFIRSQRHRHVASSLHEAVELTQLLDVTVDLEVGRMRFMRVPGTRYSDSGEKKNVEAFWAFGVQEFPSVAPTRLVLVGSLDGITRYRYAAADAALDRYSFPSDPSFMIEILNHTLQLGVDLDDYTYETEWTPEDSTNGMAARTAEDITERARGGASGGRSTWVRERLPSQRVIAVVNDISVDGDLSRTVLARPVCISSTL